MTITTPAPIVLVTPASPTPYALDFVEVGKVCHTCAVVVTNDDDSMLDEDQAQAVRAAIRAIKRDVGPDLFIGDRREDGPSAYRCAICGDDTIDNGARAVVAIDVVLNLDPLVLA